MSPASDERDRIRAAMDRILGGTPGHSNGALTIVALATEAGVPRNALTQRHTDLEDEFYDKVRSCVGMSAPLRSVLCPCNTGAPQHLRSPATRGRRERKRSVSAGHIHDHSHAGEQISAPKASKRSGR